MNEQDSGAAGRVVLIAGGAVLSLVAACCLGVVILAGGGGGAAAGAEQFQQGTGGHPLRPDAPVPPRYLQYVLSTGSLCPEIGPAEIAAQIDLESSWNPNAYTDSGQVPAKGIAQFTDATWRTWGHDYDNNATNTTNTPYDPGEAIPAQGHLMCDLVSWAKQNLAGGKLHGDLLDLAWAAYFDGRGGILAAGRVPAAGLAHDYPQQIRDRLPKYAAINSGPPVGPGGWTLPLRKGSYTLSSPFGPRWGSFHYGQDMAAPTNTPIYAAAAGTVIEAQCTSPTCAVPGSLNMPGGGWTVVINHGGGICTLYHHAVRLGVTAGQQVQAGQVIAWVGSTGHSTGPHLHFQVHQRCPPANNSTAVDPIPFLRSVGLNP